MLMPVLAGLAALLVVLCAGSLVHEPVSRTRLELFARRQRLHITATNGNQVIAYLATTRRWRAAGLVTGILVSIAWTVANGGFAVHSLTLFAGWFAGACAAEVRSTHLSLASRRAAFLRPRRPAAYLPRPAWALLTVCVALSVAIAIATAVLAALGDARPGVPAVFWLLAALVVAAMVRSAQLRALRRPQPLAEPDVIRADDAIRSRSLHVLAGGGAALVLYCCSGQLAALNLAPNSAGHDAIGWIQGIGIVLIPVIGFSVGTWPWGAQGAGSASAHTAAAGST